MRGIRVAVFGATVVWSSVLVASAAGAGNVTLVDGTMQVQGDSGRSDKWAFASLGVTYGDGHREDYVSFETGRTADTWTIAAPCRKAEHTGKIEIICPAELTQRVHVQTGDGNDRVLVEDLLYADLTVDAGVGNDRIDALGATSCHLIGGEGNDTLAGCQRDALLEGGNGKDKLSMPWILVGNYLRQLQGGPGNDRLTGNVGVDTFDGGAGSDRITSSDDAGAADAVACGDDYDSAYADPFDLLSDCERVTLR